MARKITIDLRQRFGIILRAATGNPELISRHWDAEQIRRQKQ
jgi:hypothetical protein